MYKITCLWLLLCLSWSALGERKYVAQSSQQVYAKEAGGHYETNHYEYEHKPYPYRFGYDIKDEKGNVQYHKEEGDEYNVKKGSYGYTDAYGVYRHVDYIADHQGFRAKIRTNEPGTANSHPAYVSIYAEPPPSHVYTGYNHYSNAAHQELNHVAYGKSSQSVYQQPDHAGYDNSAVYDDYDKSDQSNYDIPLHKDSVNADYDAASHQVQSSSSEENYSKNQKYRYVPVYVPNNLEYKD